MPGMRIRFSSDEEWLQQFSVETICKYFTYIIWTESLSNGYFVEKVKDESVYLVLTRLESLLYTNAG